MEFGNNVEIRHIVKFENKKLETIVTVQELIDALKENKNIDKISSKIENEIGDDTFQKDCTRKRNKYEVSCKGEIKLNDTKLEKECVKGINYLKFGDRVSTIKIYRLVAEAWLERPDGCTVVHHIKNSGGYAVDNLIWLTKEIHDYIHSQARKF